MPRQVFADDNSQHNNLFSLSLKELLNVRVVSATKQTQKVSDAPAIINVITADEIKKIGAVNLFDILTLVPGFTPISQLKSDRVMVVRGLALKDGVLVLIDGVPVNDAFDGSFDFYLRPVDDIDRVEIIRGPGSALYGGYAVSAIVHLFTKSHNKSKDLYAFKLSTGSFNEKQFSLVADHDLSYLLDDLTLAASFSYFENQGDSLTIVQDSLYRPSQAEFLAPLVSPTLTPTKRQESHEKFNAHANLQYQNLKLIYQHSQIITSPLISHVGVVTEEGQTIKDSLQDRMSLHHQFQQSKKLNIGSKLYWIINQKKLFGQSEPPQFHGDEDQDGLNEEFASGIIESFRHETRSLGAEIEFNYQFFDGHHLLLGLVADHTKLTDSEKIANMSLLSRGPSAVFPARDLTSEFIASGVKRKLSALYLQDSWQINEKASFTSGLRYGDYSDFGATLNPRIGLTYHFNSDFYSKFLYGEAFKPPAFSQLFDATPTLSSSRKRGNADLKPTEIKSLEAQLGYHFSKSLQSSLTLFRNDTTNEIFFDSTPGLEKWQNSGARESQGLEIELRGAFMGFDYAYANYSYQKTKGVHQGAGANIHPPHRANIGGHYQLGDDYLVGFNLAYFSSPKREVNDTRERVGEKTLVNLNFQSSNVFYSELDLDFSISNLLDEDGRYEVEAAIGLLDDVPIEGRAMRLNLRYQF